MRTRTTASKFLKVQCSACSNQQTLYNKPAAKVKCLACGKTIATATGGKAMITGKVVEVLE